MINIFRKYQQGMMIGVTFVIIISFVWFYNRTSMDKLANSQDRIATIYGRGISQLEAERRVRKFQLCAELGLYDLIQSLTSNDRQRMYEDFVWNSLVLEHEAKANQIQPTEEEVLNAIKKLPLLQTDGQFDPQKYANFVQQRLTPRGFTEQQLEEIIRNELRLRQLKEVVASTVEVSPSELKVAYDIQHQKTKVSVVRMDLASIANSINVTDAEVAAAYEQRKSTLNTEESRKIKFVSLSLPTGEQAPEGKARIEVLQKLARQAEEFSQAMLAKDAQFEAVAAKFSLPVQETGEFTKRKPDEKLKGNPELVNAAFQVTIKDPNSDPIQTENGFNIIHLEKVAPARPLTLEEAKPALAEAMKNDRAREMLTVKSNEIRTKIEAALKAGKPFAEAVQEAGQKPESFPEFALAELGDLLKQPDAPTIIQKSLELQVGQLSDLLNATNGGVMVYVESRKPVSNEQFQKDKDSLQENFTRSKRNVAFREWLRMRREAAKIQPVAQS